MNGKTTLKKVWSIVSTAIVVVVVLIAVFLMGMRLIGLQAFTVLSGSMEPQYRVGDLIYVQKVDPSKIEVGDAITFVMNEHLTVATHQVIRIDAEKQHFYTKGIANDTPDALPVHFNNLIGRPLFSIPRMGYVSAWIQNPPGTYITIALCALFVAALFLPDIIRKKNNAEQQSTVSESEELADVRRQLEEAKAQLEAARTKSAENKADDTPLDTGDES